MAAEGTQAAANQKASRGRGSGPRVNLSDIPETMPGAQPRANPAQRFDFEQRCRELHRDSVEEERETQAAMRTARSAEAASFVTDLEAMFPLLDPALIRSLVADAPSQQHAIEMLLTLSASMGGEEGCTVRAATPPPRNLGVEDHEKFPTLGGSPTKREEPEEDEAENPGSAWRDRAKAAAGLPAPPRPALATTVAAPRRRKEASAKEEVTELQQPLTDYEFRQKAGQRRARHRALYGRGSGRNGTQAARRRAANDDDASDSEDSDEDADAAAAAGGLLGGGAAATAHAAHDDEEAGDEFAWASRTGPPLRHHAR